MSGYMILLHIFELIYIIKQPYQMIVWSKYYKATLSDDCKQSINNNM